RSNSRVPSWRSSLTIPAESVGWVTLTLFAARLKFPVSATARKYRSIYWSIIDAVYYAAANLSISAVAQRRLDRAPTIGRQEEDPPMSAPVLQTAVMLDSLEAQVRAAH